MPKQNFGINRRRRRGWTACTASLTALGAVFATMQRPAFADATTPTPPPVVAVNGTSWVQVSSPAQLEYIDLNQTAPISAGSNTTYLNANIELMGNIAITSGWTPLVTFNGIFDGQGYEITGLNVNGDYSNEGFVGELGSSGMIKHLGVEITVSGGGKSSNNGGLVGLQDIGSSIIDSYAIVPKGGTISGDGNTTGGLVGLSEGTITGSYALESLSGGDSTTGGLVGLAEGTITDSYAIGTVISGDSDATGGLVGDLNVGDSITDSYAVGFVSGSGYFIGGLIGVDEGGSFSGLFYDSSLSTWPGLAFGGEVPGSTLIGLTDTQMKEQSSYTGWDFTNTWGMDPAINDGYPYLRANASAPEIDAIAVGPGTEEGTTSVTVTPNASGDTFDVLLSSGSITGPNEDSVPPSGANPYTSGSNLAAASNQYIGVYELNSNGQVDAFSQFQLTSQDVAVDAITTSTASNGEVGAPYGITLQAEGGDGNYTWSLANGAPSWLHIDSSTGALSGTPTTSGSVTFTVNVVDGLGRSNSHTYTINITPMAPTTSAAVSPAKPNGNNGWYTTAPTVTLTASDTGSGVESTSYSLDGGASWSIYSGPFTVTDGASKVEFYSTDVAGIKETPQELDFSVDTTAPTTSAAVSPAQPNGNNGWYTTAPTVTLTASDTGSGVASTSYSLDGGASWNTYLGPFAVNQDGKYTVLYYSTDKAGNQETVKSFTVNVDKTPPTINIVSPIVGSYLDDQSLTVTYAVLDNLSGVDNSSISATLDGQAVTNGDVIALYKLAPGSHTFTVSASDSAGNTGTQSVTFQVTTSVNSLQSLVSEFTANGSIDNTGMSNALRQTLTAGNLTAFSHQVKAQSGKHINATVAQYLLRDAALLAQ